MANILFRKSYLHKTFDKVTYESLWNTKGVFTTIRLIGLPPKLLFLKDHLNNLNRSIKKMNIDFTLKSSTFENLLRNKIKMNVKYDHLLRLAVNNKKISITLRKRLKYAAPLKGILVNYQRPNPSIKNLYYKKILGYLKKINSQSCEVILVNKRNILEGCTTNVLFVSRNKIYSPVKNIYEGTTLKFFKRKIKTIKKKDISLDRLPKFDEIILIGSGKGVVSVNSIDKPYWRRKSLKTYRFLSKIYQQAITNCPLYNG